MRDDFDFHYGPFRQRGDLDGGTRREIVREIFRINFIHAGEVGEVREEDGAFHDIGESQLLIIENRLYIFQNAFGLRFDVGADWPTYKLLFAYARYADLWRMLEIGDPGYQFLSWLVGCLGTEIWLVNLICAAIFWKRNLPPMCLAGTT